ncbi:addiction module protein [Marinobacter sp. SS21]|uniref:addiction module protein n=1 Tax=Marinobacter sp. SS21 TaxID=2979460 RepID=UPI003FA53456
MSRLEKIQAMEQLWESLTSEGRLPEIPEWHGEELASRTERISEKKVCYIGLRELKERGRVGR